MKPDQSHIGDAELLLAAAGELSDERAFAIRRHLSECPSCRMRHAGLEHTMADVVRAHRQWDHELPRMEVSRVLLRARLAEVAQPRSRLAPPAHRLAWAATVLLLAAIGALLAGWPHPRAQFAPNAAWTPGSVRPMTLDAVCASPDRDEGAAVVSATVAREVFHRYGIRNPHPRSYEVDYLIPPALGGSSDPRNLWPQPYSAGVWNARVKDALEDRLHTMVCTGRLDLATAQRELAHDWIAAYKKYFRTATPLLDHVAFVKDRPWE